MTRILRLRSGLDKTGQTRSPFYADINVGLMTKPVKIGSGRAVGWPEHELDAIVAARIAGASNDEIKRLVQRLHDQRKTAMQMAEAA